ncbi:MAG: sterol desaturase family protein [Alphaproteobacteria bacterium]
MFHDPYLNGVFNVLGLMAALALVETIIPLFPCAVLYRRHLGANLGLTAITFGLNCLMNGFLMMGALWVSGQGAGLIQWLNLPLPGAIIVTVIVMDLATYAAHVLMHKRPFLWRVHLVHHSDAAIDVTTAFRQHPFESLWRFVFLVMAACALGAPLAAIALYRTLSAVNAVLEHANIKVPQRLDTAITFFWCSPNMHKLHHSRAKAQTDSNYGNLFSVFDRLFRTFTPSALVHTVNCGIDGYDDPQVQKLHNLLKLPFTGDWHAVQHAEREQTV